MRSGGGRRASASHILVKSEEEAKRILEEIKGGKAFSAAAKEYSTCPSSSRGGSLGNFGQGDMVPPFDKAVFTGPVGVVQGPVATQFGFHLIQTHSRDGDKKEGGKQQ